MSGGDGPTGFRFAGDLVATTRQSFGDPEPLVELVGRIAAGEPERWSGSPALAEPLARGMSRRPEERPTAAELAAALARLA